MSVIPQWSPVTERVVGIPAPGLFVEPMAQEPIRAELYDQDHLADFARQLAAASSEVRVGPGRPLLARVFDSGKALRRAHAAIIDAYHRQEPLSTDAEWLIDNFHIVADALREVREDLPRKYYRELPKLTTGPLAGLPRVYSLALGLIAHTDSALEERTLVRLVQSYQGIAVLTTGELWAIPIMLRVGLIENLRRLAEQMVRTWQDHREAVQVVQRLLESDQSSPISILSSLPRPRSHAFTVQLLNVLRAHGAAAGPLIEVIARDLAGSGQPAADVQHRELNQRQAANQLSIGNCVTSLRLLSAVEWQLFFERTSLVEAALRDDPAGVYGRQEFGTRDRYRGAVEKLARRSGKNELEVARRVVRVAEQACPRSEGPQRDPRGHVGYYLIGDGRRGFEIDLGYRPTLGERFRRLVLQHAELAYFVPLGVVTALVLIALTAAAGGGAAWVAIVVLLGLLPATELAVGLVHFLVTQALPPRVLPRLNFKDGIPSDCTTFVVMPALLLRADSAGSLLEKLEIHYLANADPHVFYALLTDFADAKEERTPEDEAYVHGALEGVKALNERYAKDGPPRFYFCHRRRVWNAAEDCWMGWERKRGKLAEFNRLLRGARDVSFTTISSDLGALPIVRYVITLDADTRIPRGAARTLIATLAHPLNRARLDPRTGQVVEGYGVLQPRVSLHLASAARSWFSRIFARSAGIDPYTTAVSDVYQDLFGMGSFTGKGIYDVDAFHAAVGERFADNTILSHDLIEGNFARCGLVSDVELYDDFPARYHVYARREHRWARGDWQLLPWLFRQGPPMLVERWKIVDNLRRSLVPPALVVMLALGWTVLPGSPWLWTALALVVVGLPVLLQVLGCLVAIVRGRFTLAPLLELRAELPYTAGQVGLGIVFLAEQARNLTDAMVRTVARLRSRRHLLEWETAASTERRLGDGLQSFWVMMWPAPMIALGLGVVVSVVRPGALPAAATFLVPWLVSPLAAFLVSRPLARHERPLTHAERRALRRIARKTWSFFETFITEHDHWLPPDNYQEDPRGVVAHRTSPTNVGLLLISTLAAHDLGYLGLVALLDRLEKTFDTLEKLERHRGHLHNWYDTRTLRPLQPGYVSTVDSGNLLGCLLTLKHGLVEKTEEAIPGRSWSEGLSDTLHVIEEMVRQLVPHHARTVENGQAEATAAREQPPLLQSLSPSLKELRRLVSTECNTLQHWNEYLTGLETRAGELLEQTKALAGAIHETPTELEVWSHRLLELVRDRRTELAARADGLPAADVRARCRKLAERADALAAGMDFRFLYDEQVNLFAVGFNLASNRLDSAHYDLLASEASLTSFLAVARGDAGRKHWFQLGRPLTRVCGHTTLISWGGTAFEYLMPRLLLRYYPNTLLDESCHGMVARQIEYGRQMGVPWGISESGFAALDGALDYQYRSFGVPGMGLKRGLARDLVIAPYATALAAMIDPRQALLNFQALAREGGEGAYGFYEAVDFTGDRLQKKRRSLVVKSYMAHHQGMSMAALADCVAGERMPRRLRAEPMVRATELLLQERVPRAVPLIEPHVDETVMRVPGPENTHPLTRRLTNPQTPSPRTHLLSNGRYHVMVTNAGGGYSRFDNLEVTRWREDFTRDHWGQFIYVRDSHTGAYWSAGHQPVCRSPDEYEVLFAADKAEFRRRDENIETVLDVAVSTEYPAEVRRLTLANHDVRARELEVTSYVEIVLAPLGADAAHPAFGKLFLETEYLAAEEGLLCRPRPRSPEQKPTFAIHVLAAEGPSRGPAQFETDRSRFLGRCRTPAHPAALDPGAELSGTTGAVLDPIFSLRRRIRVPAGQSVTLSFITAVADKREDALALASRFRDPRAVTRAFELAWAHSQVEFRDLGVAAEEAHLYQRLASSLLYAGRALRAPTGILAANRQGQSGLWRFGISGDYPIALVSLREADELPLIQQMLAAHTFWRRQGLTVDLVVLNEHPGGYFEQLQEQLQNLVRSSEASGRLNQRGGIVLLKAAQVNAEDRALLESCARVVLSGGRGALAAQVNRLDRARLEPAPLRGRRERRRNERSLAISTRNKKPEPLQFFNGVGGFGHGGLEYVIFPPSATAASARAATPAPWINVVANPQFGFLVSESGAGYTWAGNSQTNRLTPWNNDPTSDVSGEALYLRDEVSGAFWRVPASGPRDVPRDTNKPGRESTGPAAPRSSECRHGQGYTTFAQHHQGIATELTLFVPADAPVKVMRLRIRNDSARPRKLSATFYAEWVLGPLRASCAMHVVTEVDVETGTLLATNAYTAEATTAAPGNGSAAAAVAFADVNLRPRTLTGDRTEFLGRNGSPDAPAALARIEFSGRSGAGLDPCAAIQTSFELAGGDEKVVVFLLGQAADRMQARQLVGRFRAADEVETAFANVRRRWDDVLNAVQVKTPDPAFDVMMNRWLLYQALSCRVWGRSAFYQSGGAYGFRDQLQDAMALVYGAAQEARAQIVRAASRQFVEGDVQHWWHPPGGKGIRTRFSDDLLWLPFVVCHYVETTGDRAVLDEQVAYLEAPPLAPDQEEVFGQPTVSKQMGTVYEHCVRALDRGATFGAHGLPLMGTGDWNDGMNRVGSGGKGESVWDAWFLVTILRQFSALAGTRGDLGRRDHCQELAEKYRAAIEEHAWDGAWYRRAYFDDGTPLGSASNDECKIDSIAESWAVFSEVADPARARQALESLDKELVRRAERLILLFTPPFNAGPLQPGYVKGYVPGIRENGGQYTHAATWAVKAAAMLGEGTRAVEYFDLLNPIHHAETPAGVDRYRGEPYVVTADVYSEPPHVGRCGWTWYTGSAGWLYRVGLEAILGFRLEGDRLRIDPCIARNWQGFEITYRYRSATYHVTVVNPDAVERGVRRLKADGQRIEGNVVPLKDDGQTHEVKVEMG